LIAKLAFGDLCRTVVRAEQNIHVSIGNEGGEVTTTAAEWQRHMERLPQGLQQRRYGFLVFYFGRMGRKTKTSRITTSLLSVAYAMGMIVVGVAVVVILAISLCIFGVAWEMFKMVKSLWGLLDRLVEVCIPSRPTRD
jgi:hypothetical protein